MDRSEELPPPALVVVMGPKGCGKSTLIRSLVKYYTGQNLSGACVGLPFRIDGLVVEACIYQHSMHDRPNRYDPRQTCWAP